MWGLGAAVAALAASRLGGGPMFAAIAHTGAWINLFNLLPVWQLDGNRGFAALTSAQRWIVVVLFGCGWAVAHDGLFVLLIDRRRRALVRCARAADGRPRRARAVRVSHRRAGRDSARGCAILTRSCAIGLHGERRQPRRFDISVYPRPVRAAYFNQKPVFAAVR